MSLVRSLREILAARDSINISSLGLVFEKDGRMAFQGRATTIVVLLLFTCHCFGTLGRSLSDSPSRTTTTMLAANDSSFESRIVESIPRYQPEQSVSGVIRLWGHGNVKLPWMKQLVSLWEAGFQRYQ